MSSRALNLPPAVEILYPDRPATADLPQILRQQWRANIGEEVVPVAREERVWLQLRRALADKGVSERGWVGDYLDPNSFLEGFETGPNANGAG